MSHSLLFNKSDFENPVTFEMLRAVATVGAGNHIMQPYASLTAKQKRLTNEFLNNYIKTALSGADWEQRLQEDFNRLCNEEIFDDTLGEKKDYTVFPVKQSSIDPVLIEGDITETEYA
jgi:hypothetical protein